jgi:hypothetical protein
MRSNGMNVNDTAQWLEPLNENAIKQKVKKAVFKSTDTVIYANCIEHGRI